jgi:hypothetical protein
LDLGNPNAIKCMLGKQENFAPGVSENPSLADVAVQAEVIRRKGAPMIKIPLWFKAMLPAQAFDFWLIIRVKCFGVFARVRLRCA